MKLTTIILFSLILSTAIAQPDYTFVFLNKKSNAESLPKEQLDEIMKGHFANMERLAKEDKLVAAGPFDGGGGIFIFKSGSITDVEGWISTDPGVKAKRWDIEILPYQPVVGSICKVGEKYEMISYHFIRFWPEIKKYTVSDAPKLITDHGQYWKKSNPSVLVTFATFGGEAGDILITREPVDESILANDPSVSKGLIRFDKKVLWIAKGSFCEQ